MNKGELSAAVANKAELTKKDAERVTAAVSEAIAETLGNGEKVQVIGFGSFEVKNLPARKARNPRTGEEIQIDASKAPTFKAGKVLKDRVKYPLAASPTDSTHRSINRCFFDTNSEPLASL